MHHVSILAISVIFSFHVLATSEDSIQPSDSDTANIDTLVNSDSLDDTPNTAISDSLTVDSSVIDSDSQDTAADSGEYVDTMQLVPKDTVPSSEHFYRDTLTGPQKALQQIISRLKRGILLIFRSIKHLFWLIIICGIILSAILFYRRKVDSRRFMTSTRLSVMDREVQLACKYMEENYADSGLSVESICIALVTGPAFLEALFDRELGMGVTEFLTHVRINRAKLLMKKSPEVTDEELINQIGFSDYELFLQKFNEITGITVEEYLDSLSNQNNV